MDSANLDTRAGLYLKYKSLIETVKKDNNIDNKEIDKIQRDIANLNKQKEKAKTSLDKENIDKEIEKLNIEIEKLFMDIKGRMQSVEQLKEGMQLQEEKIIKDNPYL